MSLDSRSPAAPYESSSLATARDDEKRLKSEWHGDGSSDGFSPKDLVNQLPDTSHPSSSMAIEGGTSKGGTDVRWIPGVLSTARTQENGESTFQPAGLFHPSTLYITEMRRMYKSFHGFNEKLTYGVYWPFGQT